jgi:general secretion pathway protein G
MPATRSRRLAVALGAAALLATSFVPAHAEPAAPVRLETLVPGSALAFASLEDVGTLGARWEKTSLGRLFADPETRAFVDPLWANAKEGLEKAAARGGAEARASILEALDAVKGLRGQAAVCVTAVVEGKPKVAASLDFGDKVGDFAAWVTRLADAKKIPFAKVEEGGRTWWTADEGFRATVVGGAVLLSNDAAWLDAVVASGAAAIGDSLGQTEKFRKVRQTCGGADLAAFVWADVRGLISSFRPPERMAKPLSAFGIDTWQALGYGMAFRGDGIADTFHVYAPGADHGMIPMVRTGPANHAPLALAPATALLYNDNVSAEGLAGTLEKERVLFEAMGGPMQRQWTETFGAVDEWIGMSLSKDLLPLFGPETAMWAGVPGTGGAFPEVALAIRAKDAPALEAAAQKALESVATRLSGEGRVTASARTIEWHGVHLHVLDLAKAHGRGIVPFTPTWAIVDGWWIATFVPHAMKEIVLRHEAKEAGLSGEEDVKALLATAPAGHGGFIYVDTQALLNLLYDTGVPALQTAAKSNMLPLPFRVDWAMLPAARTVRPYLRSLGLFSTANDEGLTFSAQSSTGVVLPIAIFAAVAIPAFVKRMNGARGEAMRRAAEVSEHSLSTAIDMFVLENRRLPNTLEELTKPSQSGQTFLKSVPVDPWGQPYEYTVVDAATHKYEIRSAGEDRVLATDDDVVFRSGE